MNDAPKRPRLRVRLADLLWAAVAVALCMAIATVVLQLRATREELNLTVQKLRATELGWRKAQGVNDALEAKLMVYRIAEAKEASLKGRKRTLRLPIQELANDGQQPDNPRGLNETPATADR